MPKQTNKPDAFDVKKYDAKKKNTNYVRATDAMANRGQVITFYHVNSGQNMAFKAFLTTYTDTFRPEWTSEAVFGRADPIYMYKNTVRSISIAFKVPAATQSEAWENLSKVQKLTTFLYPNYSSAGGTSTSAPAQTISGAPLVRMGLMNIIRTTENGNGQPAPGQGGLVVPNNPATGLLGVIQNVTINHNLDNGSSTGGGFEQSADTDITDEDTSADSTSILPKFIEVNLDFAVIHETHLGWFDDGTFSNNAFPYNTHNSQTGQGLAKLRAEEAAAAELERNFQEWEERMDDYVWAADDEREALAEQATQLEFGLEQPWGALNTPAETLTVPDPARPVFTVPNGEIAGSGVYTITSNTGELMFYTDEDAYNKASAAAFAADILASFRDE